VLFFEKKYNKKIKFEIKKIFEIKRTIYRADMESAPTINKKINLKKKIQEVILW